MAFFALAGLIFALGTIQDPPNPEDKWVPGASPDRMVADPCDPADKGEEGMSESWVRIVMLQRGHPRDLVCGARTDFDEETLTSAEADWLDVSAQAGARALVMIGAMSRPLDDDGSWGPESEEVSHTLYLQLKADDYRMARELGSMASDPAPATP